MGELIPLPRIGDVFTDVRGDDRTMRVSCHDETGMVILSLWAGKLCRASFRLPTDEVPRLIEALAATAGPAGRDAGPLPPATAADAMAVDLVEPVVIDLGVVAPATDPKAPPVSGAFEIVVVKPPPVAEAC